MGGFGPIAVEFQFLMNVTYSCIVLVQILILWKSHSSRAPHLVQIYQVTHVRLQLYKKDQHLVIPLLANFIG